MRKKKLYIYVLIFSLLFMQVSYFLLPTNTLAAETNYLTFKYNTFENDGRLRLNGQTQIQNNQLKLTPNAKLYGGFGTAFNLERISLADNKSFSTYFVFTISDGGGKNSNVTWADGLVFTVQNQSNNAGGIGGGIGYGGIKPSVGIEFDTFRNSKDATIPYEPYNDPGPVGHTPVGDPLYTNHTAVNINGSVNHTGKTEATKANGWKGDYRNLDVETNIKLRKDAKEKHVWIDYNGQDKSLEVRINTDNTRPQTYLLKKEHLDLSAILGSTDVYAGFTAATGDAYQQHNIQTWYFANTYNPIDVKNKNYEEAPKSISFTQRPQADYSVILDISALSVNNTPAANMPLTITTGNPNVTAVPATITTDANGKASVTLRSTESLNTKVRVEAPGGIYREQEVQFKIPIVQPTIHFEGTTKPIIKEVIANDGAVDGELVITMENGTFKNGIKGNDLIVNNLPNGLSLAVNRSVDGKKLTVTFTGNAHKHSAEFSTNNVSITIPSEQIVVNGAAPGEIKAITTPAFEVQLNDPARLFVHPGTVNEAVYNNFTTGKIEDTLTVTIDNGAFKNDIGSSDITITDGQGAGNKLPSGLVLKLDSVKEKELTVSFAVYATNHDNVDDVLDAAITIDPSQIIGSDVPLTSNTFKFNFNEPEPYLVVQTPVIREADANDGSFTDTIKLQLLHGIFTDDISYDDVTINSLPTGLTIADVTKNSPTELEISLNGQALAHTSTNNLNHLHIAIDQTKIDPSAEKIGGGKITLTSPVASNTFALVFQDPLPVLTVSPDIIRDHIDGSLSGPLTITLTNGTFDADMANSVTVNNLPDGVDIEVERISDTELEITFTVKAGETIATFEGSQYASITIASGKIKDNGSIPTISALTSNTFAFDIPSDTTIVEKDKQNLKIGYQVGDHAEHVTQKLDLETTGTHGSTITWQSSDETLIANDGTVTRPPYTQGDKKVTLTATITKGQETTTQLFEVIVKAAVLSDAEAVELDKNSLKITYSAGDNQDHVTNKLTLPTSGNNGTTITWSSQPSGYIGPNGEVTRPAHGKGDQTVTLTATIKKGNIEETVTFTLIIKEETRNDGGDSSGGGSSPSAPVKETITVDVQVGSGAHYTDASRATITRTTEPDQTKRDEVHYSTSQAQETVKKAQESNLSRARLVIPDSKDEVSQVDVQIELEAVRALAQGQLDLEIFTENAKILIPQESLAGLLGELYFRVVPIKQENERRQVEERAKKEEIVREALGDGTIQVVGRPMTIETNMTSRKVTITLPLDRSLLPTTAQAREEFLSDLVIFIEHSDGDRVLVKPEVVDYADGKIGLAFTINKFSTFTILNMENWAEYLAQQEAKAIQDKNQPSKEGEDFHQAYIFGYPNGTFQPEKSITRAELAALLSRVQAGTKNNEVLVDYPDVKSTHWASKVINYAQATGLMKGYLDGTFGPERKITRAEMAAIVSRWLHLTEETQGTQQFKASDIQGHWAEKPIQLVYDSGIMKGMPNGTFQPDKALTRAEAVSIINRVLQRGPLHTKHAARWNDVPGSHWAYKEVQEASVDHHFKRTELGEQMVEE